MSSEILRNTDSNKGLYLPMYFPCFSTLTKYNLYTLDSLDSSLLANGNAEAMPSENHDSANRPQRKVSKRMRYDAGAVGSDTDESGDEEFQPHQDDSDQEEELKMPEEEEDYEDGGYSKPSSKKRKKQSSELPDDIAEKIQLSLPALSIRIRESLKRAENTNGAPVVGVPKQVPADVRLTATGKQSHARKQAPGYVKRPRNPFILFRSHACVNNLIPDELGISDHRHVRIPLIFEYKYV